MCRAQRFCAQQYNDIAAQRRAYIAVRDQREQIRAAMGLTGKRVLLFVGRFTPNKRIDFLLAAWQHYKNRMIAITCRWSAVAVSRYWRTINYPM